MTSSLQDQHVVVVGGGSGIGLATARAAAAAGARVTVVDRDPAGLARARDAVADVLLAEADVLDEPRLRAVFASGPAVDHVYVAAGQTRLGSILDDETVEDQLAALRVRLHGSAHVVRAAHPYLRVGGSIVLTGGVSTDRPVRGAWVSCIGTAAAEQLARTLALELAPLRVNAVAPGWTDTPMWDAIFGANRDEILSGAVANQPTGRLVRPEEIADAVILLMSNGSVTGEVLHVDGGARLT